MVCHQLGRPDVEVQRALLPPHHGLTLLDALRHHLRPRRRRRQRHGRPNHRLHSGPVGAKAHRHHRPSDAGGPRLHLVGHHTVRPRAGTRPTPQSCVPHDGADRFVHRLLAREPGEHHGHRERLDRRARGRRHDVHPGQGAPEGHHHRLPGGGAHRHGGLSVHLQACGGCVGGRGGQRGHGGWLHPHAARHLHGDPPAGGAQDARVPRVPFGGGGGAAVAHPDAGAV
mmetsp:Transcript_10915/g.21579  ORF Transcript_10915/g.21579 Transcript_10915/m.21579 type:complete len:227 (-) Transcript_10915:976-1656(-)